MAARYSPSRSHTTFVDITPNVLATSATQKSLRFSSQAFVCFGLQHCATSQAVACGSCLGAAVPVLVAYSLSAFSSAGVGSGAAGAGAAGEMSGPSEPSPPLSSTVGLASAICC